MWLYLQFYRALLVCAIGGKRYYLKLSALTASAIIVSISGFIFVGKYSQALSYLPHLSWVIYTTTSLSVSLCLLLGIQINTRLIQSTKLLASLPLSVAQRWSLSLAGDLLIALFCSVSIVGPLIAVSSGAKSWPQIAAIATLALLTGVAVNYMYKSRSFVARLVGIVTFAIFIKAMSSRVVSMSESSTATVICVVSIVISARALFTQLLVASRLPLADPTESTLKIRFLPWSLKLATRFKPMVMSMTICLGLILSIVYFSKRNGLSLDQSILSICLLFISSSAADIRSVFRVNKPPEVACLKGTSYWFANYILSCICVGALLALPVIAAFPLPITNLAIQIIQAISIGILSSVIVGNCQKDMSSQFMTNLLILAITYYVNRLGVESVQDNLLRVALIIVSIGTSFLIERFRNNFIWRKVDETVTN